MGTGGRIGVEREETGVNQAISFLTVIFLKKGIT